MAIEAERLVINLEARLNKFEADMRKAVGITDTKFRSIERRAAQAQSKLGRFTIPTSQIGKALDGASSQFLAFSRTAGGVLAGVLALKGAQGFIDGSIRIQNALKGAGLEGEQLTVVYDQLFAAAQRNSAPLESLVKLYSQVSLNMAALNTNSAELAGFPSKPTAFVSSRRCARRRA